MAPPREGDLKAGLTGLIVGAVLLLAVMTAIVHFTNLKYAGESPAAAETK
ncbi:MAG: hypothetical protein JWO39_661 [Gemmatimonadetes bacterium]|jgi:hypothetical protein|nr:hypothetical protein [Gemmatimonadota bacterium]